MQNNKQNDLLTNKFDSMETSMNVIKNLLITKKKKKKRHKKEIKEKKKKEERERKERKEKEEKEKREIQRLEEERQNIYEIVRKLDQNFNVTSMYTLEVIVNAIKQANGDYNKLVKLLWL